MPAGAQSCNGPVPCPSSAGIAGGHSSSPPITPALGGLVSEKIVPLAAASQRSNASVTRLAVPESTAAAPATGLERDLERAVSATARTGCSETRTGCAAAGADFDCAGAAGFERGFELVAPVAEATASPTGSATSATVPVAAAPVAPTAPRTSSARALPANKANHTHRAPRATQTARSKAESPEDGRSNLLRPYPPQR